MTIVIDCFKLVKGSGKSIGIYNLTKNLVENLAHSKGCKDHIIVLGNRRNRKDFEQEGVSFMELPYPPENKIFCVLWELFLVPLIAGKYHPDKVLYPRGFSPAIHRNKDVIIVHDLIPFFYHKQYPDALNRLENFYIMLRLKASIQKADTIITISEASKKDIVSLVKKADAKIHVIHNGCNRIKVPERIQNKGNYIAAVTSALPHKNADGIIKAYEVYHNLSENPLPLILLGIELSNVKGRIPTAVEKDVKCIGYLDSDREFYSLIAGAKFFLFLSLAEGFGFPPLEAMQLGVPVICSNQSSLPEIVGDAGILVNPQEPQEVAQAMLQLDGDTRMREELIQTGYTQSTLFSWDRTISEYRKVLLQ